MFHSWAFDDVMTFEFIMEHHIHSDFSLKSINTGSYGLKSFRYLAPKIWNLVPQEIRSANSLSQFIEKNTLWISIGIGQVGYANQT